MTARRRAESYENYFSVVSVCSLWRGLNFRSSQERRQQKSILQKKTLIFC